ncbi:MAG TPA: hypothetical protein VLF59_02190 [Candidatus Saccharimonadales bacterium]|nr:hypothetical protein [Candidatus Saccharimonadales bacterium]
MTLAHEAIPNELVIPSVDSNLFSGHEESRFALGIVAIGDEIVPGRKNEAHAYGLLRGNVYARQQRYMSEDELQADGTEWDKDDSRSVHFAAFENTGEDVRAIGSMRLVVKANRIARAPMFDELMRKITGYSLPSPHEIGTEEPLPIETHYPDAFPNGPAPRPSVEASRLISRHEDNRTQRTVNWMLLGGVASYILAKELGDCYGVVKPSLSRSFRIGGMPATELGEAEFIPEYNSSKMPIQIDIPRFVERLQDTQPDVLTLGTANSFVYSGVSPTGRPELPRAA